MSKGHYRKQGLGSCLLFKYVLLRPRQSFDYPSGVTSRGPVCCRWRNIGRDPLPAARRMSTDHNILHPVCLSRLRPHPAERPSRRTPPTCVYIPVPLVVGAFPHNSGIGRRTRITCFPIGCATGMGHSTYRPQRWSIPGYLA